MGGRRSKRRTQQEAVESVQPTAQVIKGYLVDDLLGRRRQGCKEMQGANQQRFAKLKLIRLQDGLYWTADDRLYVPKIAIGTLRDECAEAVHSNPQFGHYGVARTTRKVTEVLYWERISVDAANFVQKCDSCQHVKAPHRLPQGELHPLPIPGRRRESVSMDLITDSPPTERGYESIVVFVDRLSKMVHLAPCTKTVTAIELVHMFENNVWKLHGIPSNVVLHRESNTGQAPP